MRQSQGCEWIGWTFKTPRFLDRYAMRLLAWPVAPPLLIVFPDRIRRDLRCVEQPVARPFLQVAPQYIDAHRARGMNRGKVEGHRLQQIVLQMRRGVLAEFDLAGVGSKPPDDPLALNIEEWIRRAITASRQFQEARWLRAVHIGPG